jgi:3-dehydroquinate synthase
MHKINLDLKENSYSILIEENIIENAGKHLKSLKLGKKIFILTDKNVSPLYLNKLMDSLDDYEVKPIIMEAGEHLKSFVNLTKICNFILSEKPDRNTTLIALGGGVIGDLTGFCASVILRGINFVQIPTTLLSQVDSSVGGKTAINTNAGKNLIGSFYQPKIVLIDPNALQKLPEREFLCGYAEAVKYGLINNREFFDYLCKNEKKIKNKDVETLKYIIKTSCESKAAIVEADEKEKSGTRALLNLGHTFAHSFEKETGYSDVLKHGEAVAIGMVMALKFSIELGHCDKKDLELVLEHFKNMGLPTDLSHLNLPANLTKTEIEGNAQVLLSHMCGDKKNENDQIVFILMNAIGESFLSRNTKKDDVLKFLEQNLV